VRRVLLFLMLTAFGSGCEVIQWERKIDEQEKIIVQQKRTIEELKYLAQVDKKEADDQKKNIEELQSLVKEQNLKLATAQEALNERLKALNELEKTVESQKRALEESVVGVDSQGDADVGGVQARHQDTGGAVLIAGRSIRAGRSGEGTGCRRERTSGKGRISGYRFQYLKKTFDSELAYDGDLEKEEYVTEEEEYEIADEPQQDKFMLKGEKKKIKNHCITSVQNK